MWTPLSQWSKDLQSRRSAVRLVPFVALMFFINYLDRTAIGFAAPNGMNDDLGLSARPSSASPRGSSSSATSCSRSRATSPCTSSAPAAGWPGSWSAGASSRCCSPGCRTSRSSYVAALPPRRRRGRLLPGRDPLPQPVGPGPVPQRDPRPLLPGPAAHDGHRRPPRRLADQPGRASSASRAGASCSSASACRPSSSASSRGSTSPTARRRQVAQPRREGLADRAIAAEEGHLEDQQSRTHASAPSSATAASGRCRSSTSASSTASTRWPSSCPTIISGFEAQYGTKFDYFQKGLITAIPYLPAAIALYFWSTDATKHGVKTWHIVVPALVGAVSIPLALYAGSPAATIAVITVTACAIFSALPNFWTRPHPVPHRRRGRRGHRADQHHRQHGRLQRPVHHRLPARTGPATTSAMFVVGAHALSASSWSCSSRSDPDDPRSPAADRAAVTARNGRSGLTAHCTRAAGRRLSRPHDPTVQRPRRLRRRADRRLRRRQRPLGAPVPGGVVRSTVGPETAVAVVIGGGSGHYPAFAGLVGQGLAHGAAMGNLFASPSDPAGPLGREGRRPRRRRALQLRQLRRRRAELRRRPRTGSAPRASTAARSRSPTTSPAPARRDGQAPRDRRRPHGLQDRRRRRRGRLRPGPRSSAVARRANDRTRSFGVAFAGCTLPGADAAAVHRAPRADGGRARHPRRARHRRDRRPDRRRARRAAGAGCSPRCPSGVDESRGAGAWSDPQRPRLASSTRSCSSSTAASPSCSREAGLELVDPEVGEFSSRASTWPASRSPCSGSTTN